MIFKSTQRRSLNFFLFAVLTLLFSVSVAVTQAQCPTSIAINSTTITAATCPSNGQIVVNSTGGATTSYQITAGPAGYPTGAQSSNTFKDLLPGTYTVKVFCSGNPAIFTTTTVTIANQYVPIQATATVSNVCTSNTPGGTISAGVTAGNGPYQYAYFTGDPNVADNTLTYGTANTYAAPAFGTYNVRIKDGCGLFVTKQVTIARTYPANLCITGATTSYGNLTCAQLTDSVYLNFSLSNSITLATLPAAGITLELYENNGTCAAPVQGALITTQHYGPDDAQQIKIPRRNVLIKIKTPCGDSCTFCYTYTTPVFSFTAAVTQNGCATPANPNGTMGINVDLANTYVLPVTFTVKNSAGVVVATYTMTTTTNGQYSFPNQFPLGNYTVTATDACGSSNTQPVTPPATTGTGAQVTATPTTVINSCTSQNGRVSLTVTINGLFPNLKNAVATIIAPSPTHVGTVGVHSTPNTYDWINILPGATYYIQLDNGCGLKDTLQITTPTGTGQNQQILTTVTQLCGGKGNIDVTISRLGGNTIRFVLKNSAGTVVGTGTTTGSFANLPADTYSIDAKVTGGCSYTFSKTDIVILPSGSGPTITKKVGVLCEDANGNTLPTGKAILAFLGAQPIKVDYKLTAAPDASYINLTNASDGSETIDNLLANTSYSVRITDACGNANITQISLGKLSPLATETTVQPCTGSNYTLSVPDMGDEATYEWKKDNIIISNQPSINFPSYTAAENGTYTCTVTIGTCVTRIVTVTLSSTACGGPLPVKLTYFTATAENKTVVLNWSTANEQNNAGFDVMRSNDAVSWSKIGLVASKGTNGNSSIALNYKFIDATPLSVTSYYRLYQRDFDGKVSLSDIRKIVLAQSAADITVYPVPASTILNLAVGSSNIGDAATVSILAMDGKTVRQISYGKLSQKETIDVSNINSGKYILRIVTAKQTITKAIQVIN